MADNDDVMNKADALMRRHRVFVAGAAADETAAGADDVPTLTEVVDPHQMSAAAPVQASIDVAKLNSALAFELDTWLDEELPRHVMRVLDGVTDQLIGQLSLQARSELLPRLQQLIDPPESKPSADPDHE